MKRTFGLLALAVVAALLTMETAALADLLPNGGGGRPRPRPRPPIEEPAPQPAGETSVPLTYREDANATTSRMVIPRRYVEQAGWRKTAGGPDGAEHIAQSEGNTRTIVAGIALSLAAVSVVLLRRKSRAVQGATLVIALGAGILAATQLLTAAEPRDKVDPNAGGGAKVIIEIAENGDGVQFVRGTR